MSATQARLYSLIKTYQEEFPAIYNSSGQSEDANSWASIPAHTLHYSQRENIQNLDRTGQSQQQENIINTIGF